MDENSKLEALVNAKTLQVDMYERADARIDGNVDSLQVNTDNASNFKGKNLTTKTSEVKCALNSDVYIQALNSLRIDASGNSEVYIYGNPVITLDNFRNSSKLFKKDLK